MSILNGKTTPIWKAAGQRPLLKKLSAFEQRIFQFRVSQSRTITHASGRAAA
jgi:hypothetical protein